MIPRLANWPEAGCIEHARDGSGRAEVAADLKIISGVREAGVAVMVDYSPCLRELGQVGELLTEPLPAREGFVVAPDRAGNGLDWNEDLVRTVLA